MVAHKLNKLFRFIVPYQFYVALSRLKTLQSSLSELELKRSYRLKMFYHYIKISGNVEFLRSIESKVESGRRLGYTGGGILAEEGWLIYALIRVFKPQIVVETGVGAGMSSLFILRALHNNSNGTLVSIDLPNYDKEIYPKLGKHFDVHVPESLNTGWLIPSCLKSRWTLIHGDAREVLPKILKENVVDFFFHDSLHTEEHMKFEYTCALEHLNTNGIIASHDVHPYWSDVFIRFCDENSMNYGQHYLTGIALIDKTKDAR